MPIQQLAAELRQCAEASESGSRAAVSVKLHSAAATLSQRRVALHKEFTKAAGHRLTLSVPEWVSPVC